MLKLLSPAMLLAAIALNAAQPAWLSSVAPIITPVEKKAYLALPLEGRAAFEERFWSTRSIDREEYELRLAYIDAKFGSSKRGSGANTDPGRVYLSLGPPTKITHIPSSRIFVPLEIWYYDQIPGYLNTELHLIFFQPKSVGLPKLYSPTIDTIRVLFLPEASTIHMFGPNDSVTESDIRQNLTVGPAEDEVITAASAVATGIKYEGNDQILGQITSPEFMLSKAQLAKVTSRLVTTRPDLDTLQTVSSHGAMQVDLRLVTSATREIRLEVFEGAANVYNNRLTLQFPNLEPVEYTHRLDLLPGSYRLLFTVDGKAYAYPLEVTEAAGGIQRVDVGSDLAGRHTPFEFDGRQLKLNPSGRVAFLPVSKPGKVDWTIRQGMGIVWHTTTEAQTIALVELPALPPGQYKLEAESQTVDLTLPTADAPDSKNTLVSFNANLAPSKRLSFIANQWLLRGRVDRARETLAKSEDALALARIDAMSGNLDGARERVSGILASHPDNFEALAVMAYIETKFQDYPVAADLYRRALALQDSPALRTALANLPTH